MTIWPFGVALILRFFGVPSRPIFSLVGIWILFFWLLPDDQFTDIFGEFDGDIEMFFVSGICMVIGATIVIVQNTDVLLRLVSSLGIVFRSKLPAIRTAVAYPGSARGRTGMTIAMFSLVIFSLIMIATLSANFSRIFINDDATAGWDIQVFANENNPIPDLRATLEQTGVDVTQIDAIGRQRSPSSNGSDQARIAGRTNTDDVFVWGLDPTYLDNATLLFGERAAGYDSDEAVVEALKNEPGVAVVSSMDVNEAVLDIDPEDGFDPIEIEVVNSVTGDVAQLRVIGVIDAKVSTLFGIYANESSLTGAFPDMRGAAWTIKVAPGADLDRLADRIESALLRYGALTQPVREELEEAQSINNGFFYLIQGFMGLGLIVGVAAIGVISFRSVVERRQQIGVLRAIGFQKNMVSLSFMIESAFVVGIGAISGLVLGLALAYNLLNSDDVSAAEGFVIPWPIVLSIFFGTVAVSLLMTWIPSRQAASIAPAEALRYE
jgi:putative ABC transport system permease protein